MTQTYAPPSRKGGWSRGGAQGRTVMSLLRDVGASDGGSVSQGVRETAEQA